MLRNRSIFLSASALALVVVLAASGFKLKGAERESAQNSADLLLVASSELKGYLEPCGCYKPQIGGFLRRASYLSGLKTPSVRVDNGDLSDLSGRQSEIKAETVIEYFNLLKYDAVGLGETDFRLGVEFLRALQAAYKGSLVCANVVGADGKPLFKDIAMVNRKVKGKDTAVAVLALLSPGFASDIAAADSTLKMLTADETLPTLQSRASKAKYVVLLYHGPKAEATEIAKRYPWIHAIVYAHASDSPADTITSGSTMLVQPGQKGKYLAEIPLRSGATFVAEQTRMIALGPDLKDDPAAKSIRSAYQARVKAEGLLLAVKKLPAPPGGGFVGSNQCAGCHRPAHKIWQATSHAKAFKTLEDVGSESDPECVGCHVVGLAYEGGFQSAETTPKLKDVGCESCHGPSLEHVTNEKKLPKVGEGACLQCHVPDHSPSFEFQSFWEKIKH